MGVPLLSLRSNKRHTRLWRTSSETGQELASQMTALGLQVSHDRSGGYDNIVVELAGHSRAGEIVQRVTHAPLEEFVAREIYQPLKMTDTLRSSLKIG